MNLRETKPGRIWIINQVGQVEEVELAAYKDRKHNGVPARCGLCAEYAIGIDPYFPFHSAKNRCANHLKP